MKEFLYVLLIGFVIGSALTYFVKPGEVIERIDSVRVEFDTNLFVSKYEAELKAKLRSELAKRPFKVVKVKENVDSLIAEARAYFRDSLKALENGSVYIAYMDSSFQDDVSTVDISVDYCSPIPLHWDSYFKMKIKAYHECIDSAKTIYKKVIVEIEPPFYRNTWFWGTAAMTLIAIL